MIINEVDFLSVFVGFIVGRRIRRINEVWYGCFDLNYFDLFE